MRQIETINPHVIVTLGRFSMAVFLPDARISSIHGQARLVQGKIIVPMYHPAAALHQPLIKPTIEHDFANLKETLRKAKEASQTKQIPPVQQVEKKEPGPGNHIDPLADQGKKAPEHHDPKQMKLF
jgi:DNA polymerase